MRKATSTDDFLRPYRVFFKFCVFSKILKYILDSGPVIVCAGLYALFSSVSVFILGTTDRWMAERGLKFSLSNLINHFPVFKTTP